MTDGEPGETGPNTTSVVTGAGRLHFWAREGAICGSLVECVPPADWAPAPVWAVRRCRVGRLRHARRLERARQRRADHRLRVGHRHQGRRLDVVRRRFPRACRDTGAPGVPPGLRPTARRFRPSWGRPEPGGRGSQRAGMSTGAGAPVDTRRGRLRADELVVRRRVEQHHADRARRPRHPRRRAGARARSQQPSRRARCSPDRRCARRRSRRPPTAPARDRDGASRRRGASGRARRSRAPRGGSAAV